MLRLAPNTGYNCGPNHIQRATMKPTVSRSFSQSVLSLALLAAPCAPLAAAGLASKAASEAATVYVAGDIADCRKTTAAVSAAARTAALIVSLLKQDAQARVLTVGDNTYPDGALSEFTDCYAPTWGQFKQLTHPAPGNHEYKTPKAAGYFDYFGEAAGPERRGYYRLQLGTWQVYSLNSFLKPEEHAAQLAWLKKELAANRAPCTLAYWHHPLFSSGPHGNSERMRDVWDVLYDANAQVVLTGHDHHYERFAPQDGAGQLDLARGITEFVVGTGGSELYPIRSARPNSVVSQNQHFGVLKLSLQAGRFDWQFLSVNGAAVQDSGGRACH